VTSITQDGANADITLVTIDPSTVTTHDFKTMQDLGIERCVEKLLLPQRPLGEGDQLDGCDGMSKSIFQIHGHHNHVMHLIGDNKLL